MIPVVFINCDTLPFLDLIISLDKPLETRTRNTLRSLVHKSVLLAETKHGKKPLVKCWATIGTPMEIRSREEWELYKPLTCTAGSKYDWKPDTKVKYIYTIYDVYPIQPFTPPEGTRHGRTWMEYTGSATPAIFSE